MDKIFHIAALFLWTVASKYSIIELEKEYDLGLCIVLFLCGVIACSQIFILLTKAEEIVCLK
jgi:hypothetical protein